MYKNDIQSVILERMLEKVNAKFDKREGSIIWDALAPAAVEFENFYILLMAVLDEVFADTATRSYLIRRCAERGITPKPASYAIVRGEFTPNTIDIPIGSRFSHEDYNYIVTEKESDGVYQLKCETIGSDVNGITGQLIPITYIQGLQTAYITEVVIPGENEEETESLRNRYMTSLQSEAFGGNRLDYKTKVLGISGVGGVKIYSGAEWNGGGTVKVVFVDSDHNSPSEELVEKVQETIDQNCLARTKDGEMINYELYVKKYGEVDYQTYLENTDAGVVTEREFETNDGVVVNRGSSGDGSGSGLAPIGHIVTVVGAHETLVDVDMTLTYASGYTWDKVKESVETAIEEYFDTLNKNWSSYDKIRVRISQLESRILNIQGIIDIQGTKIGIQDEELKEGNLEVDANSIIKKGNVNGK